MGGVGGSAPWVGKVVRRANLFLFSLNLAWMTTWYLLQRTSLCNGWPLQGDVVRISHSYFWMPEPGVVVRQAAYSFVLCVPFVFVLFVLARFPRVSAFLRAAAGAFALTGFPILALWFCSEFLNLAHWLDHIVWLIPETVAVLACGTLFYLRKWPLPGVVNIALLLAHFSLWAWLTGQYTPPFAFINAFPPELRRSVLEVGFRLCIMTMYHDGFPVIGFLSALIAAMDLKLAGSRATKATMPAA